ncbi:MAG: DUF2877 domain-containing protein [Actinomycetota bacterium]|nr:DUF2877 domain-containing protein [Actinomycetota bacterium]
MAATQVSVSAPSRVAARLRASPDGSLPVLHAGPDAVYVDLDGWALGVVSARATQVPCALRAGSSALPEVGSCRIDGGVLHLDATPVVVGRLVATGVPRLAVGVSMHAPPDPADLLGRGDGLTPYGDDVLCGWLAIHRAAGVPTPDLDEDVRRLLPRTTLLSATLLDCALRGEVVPEFAAYVAALGTPAQLDAETALRSVGGSSGAGLLEGARWALAA